MMPSVVEDSDQIRQLIGRYCHLFDTQQAAEWAGLFTDDGVFDLAGNKTVGTEALTLMASGGPNAKMMSMMRHVVTNTVIDVDGDDATSRSYVLMLKSGAQPSILSTGRYEDKLQRVDGDWRFAERRFIPDPPEG